VKVIKIIYILLTAVIMILVMGIGCEDNRHRPSEPGTAPPSNTQPSTGTNTNTNKPPPAQTESNTPAPVSGPPSFFDFPVPTATGERVEGNQKAEVDYSNAADGYIMVRFLNPTDTQLRVRVIGPSGVEFPPYTLDQNGEFIVLPLSDGNGVYNDTVWEHIEGQKYALALNADINVTLTNELAPFLRPNQYVNFTPDSAIVQKAAELVGGKTEFFDKVEAIYHFVVNNITYDTDFAEAVIAGGNKGYLPDLDDVLRRGYGVCFDYAALMTGMLRSQGIPTKLVIGFAGDIYHAWISVFSEKDGWIENAITFDGNQWNLMDPTFASTGNQSANVMQFIGDGENYNAMFFY